MHYNDAEIRLYYGKESAPRNFSVMEYEIKLRVIALLIICYLKLLHVVLINIISMPTNVLSVCLDCIIFVI